MSNRDALKKELEGLPEPVLGEVVDFIRLLKARNCLSDQEFWSLLRKTFGSMPDLVRPPQGEMPPPRTWA